MEECLKNEETRSLVEQTRTFEGLASSWAAAKAFNLRKTVAPSDLYKTKKMNHSLELHDTCQTFENIGRTEKCDERENDVNHAIEQAHDVDTCMFSYSNMK